VIRLKEREVRVFVDMMRCGILSVGLLFTSLRWVGCGGRVTVGGYDHRREEGGGVQTARRVST